MSPRSFGKYSVLARLATGGAASIFLARQPGAAGFHKLVCLKTLLPERCSDADFLAMFLDEARLAARLTHPNCVQIYDLGQIYGVYYISMEYIFGETLWNLLTTVTKLRTPLPTDHVASIIANVCDGLHHAHELRDADGRPYNLVHRDVSPQNIMITFQGQTKVVDFGIAKAETGRAPTMAGIVKGKFSYMSPEQITGGEVDRRSDVYSLGIVMFECLASRRLYRGDSPEDIARLILEHRAPRLRDVVPGFPAALDRICAKALSRHPAKRFQTAQEMGEALRNYLEDIRFKDSVSALAELLEKRFEGQIAERRTVYEAAHSGTYDESELMSVLCARPVRAVDLFPEGEPPVEMDETDFSESFAEETVQLLDDADTEAPAQNKENSAVQKWQLEVNRDGSVPSISMLPDDGDSDAEASEQDATRVDPSALEVDPTIAGIVTSSESDSVPFVVAAGAPLDGQTDPERSPLPTTEAATENLSDAVLLAQEQAAMEISEEEQWDDQTRREEVDEDIFPDLPDPSVDSAALPTDDPADFDVVAVDPPTNISAVKPKEQLEDGVDLELIASPHSPTIEPLPPRVELTTQPPSRGSEPTETGAPPSLAERRFGHSSLMASFAIGISIGIVIGLLLAKIFIAVPQPTRIMPVVPPKQTPAESKIPPAPPDPPEQIDPAKQIEPIAPISD